MNVELRGTGRTQRMLEAAKKAHDAGRKIVIVVPTEDARHAMKHRILDLGFGRAPSSGSLRIVVAGIPDMRGLDAADIFEDHTVAEVASAAPYTDEQAALTTAVEDLVLLAKASAARGTWPVFVAYDGEGFKDILSSCKAAGLEGRSIAVAEVDDLTAGSHTSRRLFVDPRCALNGLVGDPTAWPLRYAHLAGGNMAAVVKPQRAVLEDRTKEVGLGQASYEAWHARLGDGVAQVVPWDTMPESRRTAWEAAGKAAREWTP